MSSEDLSLRHALEIGVLDAHDQAALVRSGQLSAVELTASAIARAQHFQALGALSHTDFSGAMTRACKLDSSAGLAGVPWLPKDSLLYAGMPTRGGSRSRTGSPASASSPFAHCFDAAGLVAIGKSTMPEFGLIGSTEPLLGPVTRNPWKLSHSPGGSSGGAGAALAAGIVPLAHGSDGAGSIRIPASACGVVGLKPGRGSTVRVRDRHAIEDLIVADSLMARSVRDVAWAFAAAHVRQGTTHANQQPLRRLKVAMVTPSLKGTAPHPHVAQTLQQAAHLCEGLGHRVEAVDYPFDGAWVWRSMHTLWSRLGLDAVQEVTAARGSAFAESSLEPWTWGLAKFHLSHCGVPELEEAYRMLAQLPTIFADFHQRYDVLLTPTLSAPPPPLGELAPDRDFDELLDAMFGWISYTPLQNLAGTPAISLPLGNAEGLPIGVQFAADRGQEPLLLQLAAELEQAAPWAGHWPSTSVVNALKEMH